MSKPPYTYRFSALPETPELKAKRIVREMNRVLGIVSRAEAEDSGRAWHLNPEGYLIFVGDRKEIESTPIFLKTAQDHNTRIRDQRTK